MLGWMSAVRGRPIAAPLPGRARTISALALQLALGVPKYLRRGVQQVQTLFTVRLAPLALHQRSHMLEAL